MLLLSGDTFIFLCFFRFRVYSGFSGFSVMTLFGSFFGGTYFGACVTNERKTYDIY